MGIVKKSKIFRKGKSGALGAAPGDVDGFVREVSDSAVVAIERAFTRAGLTVAGKPLGARAESRYGALSIEEHGIVDGGRVWSFPSLTHPMATAARARFPMLLHYAWFARQFVRGATGAHLLDDENNEIWSEPNDPRLNPGDSPEARLGLDLWRLGRNVAGEFTRAVKSRQVPVYHSTSFEQCLESVRTRLNWPRLPDNYDPPPPSEWPEDD